LLIPFQKIQLDIFLLSRKSNQIESTSTAHLSTNKHWFSKMVFFLISLAFDWIAGGNVEMLNGVRQPALKLVAPSPGYPAAKNGLDLATGRARVGR